MKNIEPKNDDSFSNNKYEQNNYDDQDGLEDVYMERKEMRKNKSLRTKKSQKHQVDLSVNEALILQQVFEEGEDEVDNIVDQAGMPKKVTMNVLSGLKSKGLLTIIQHAYGRILVSVTSQGKKLVHAMWPEAVALAY